MRNDIVHNLGLASYRNSARCQVLPALSIGQVVSVEHDTFAAVRSAWRHTTMVQIRNWRLE